MGVSHSKLLVCVCVRERYINRQWTFKEEWSNYLIHEISKAVMGESKPPLLSSINLCKPPFHINTSLTTV